MNKYVLLLLIAFTTQHIRAQKERLMGLWEIEKVKVGDEEMTPVAKWTRINKDGSYTSGNGWLQNAKGIWQYNNETTEFTAFDSLMIEDEYGGFTVAFEKKKMLWTRVEEGMSVNVTLKPIHELPMSPADYFKGLWGLDEVKGEHSHDEVTLSADNERRLFVRWDRVYVEIDEEGNRSTGYWHIDGHRPDITFLPHEDGKNAVSWRIEVNELQLKMTGISEENKGTINLYSRLNSF